MSRQNDRLLSFCLIFSLLYCPNSCTQRIPLAFLVAVVGHPSRSGSRSIPTPTARCSSSGARRRSSTTTTTTSRLLSSDGQDLRRRIGFSLGIRQWFDSRECPLQHFTSERLQEQHYSLTATAICLCQHVILCQLVLMSSGTPHQLLGSHRNCSCVVPLATALLVSVPLHDHIVLFF